MHERLHGLLCSGKYEVFSRFLQCFWDSQDDNLTSDTSNRRVLHGSNAKEQLSLTDWGSGYVDICIDWRAWTVACAVLVVASMKHSGWFYKGFWDSQDDNLTSDTSNRRVLHGSNAKEQLSLTDWGPRYVDFCIDWRAWTVACAVLVFASMKHSGWFYKGFWDSQDDNLTSDTSNRRALHGSNAKEQLSLTDWGPGHVDISKDWRGWTVACAVLVVSSVKHSE